MHELRKIYRSGLLQKLELELNKEIKGKPLDYEFLEKVIKMRPSELSQPEIDTRIEILASRFNKIFEGIPVYGKNKMKEEFKEVPIEEQKIEETTTKLEWIPEENRYKKRQL